ncbi:hypothetical protein [uncultured Psychroserpens sp.]|uniref:hypothetical protein n=1 Tax=uncultured Psychroserpens sp. TaxID=255436 RepID=UPI0026346AE9|nr:hypothetical protein [uncultured Psychroserpens sp.]
MKSSYNPKVNICLSLLFFLCLTLNLTMCKKAEDSQQSINEQTATKSSDSTTKDVKTSGIVPITSIPIKELDSLFSLAMLDAQNPEPSEISHNLINLETNKNLIDTTINGEHYIKMVSWKLNPAWYPKKGKFNNGNRVIWVTAAPIIKDSCRSFYKNHKDPNMRLRQLLGLQPFTPETFFLELWVKPSDMFRPGPDNEVNDNTCGLNLPNNVTPDYRKWFNNTRATQYNDCKDTLFNQYGYPWTQLGYTYDWSPDNPTHVGLSEFVIKENTNMFVSGEYPNRVYCASN